MPTTPIRTITSSASSAAGTIFLFAHGAGFYKRDPVIRRLQQQLPAPSSRFVTFDFSHHGSNQRVDAASSRVFYPTPESPHVILPDIEWSSTAVHEASMHALRLRLHAEKTNQRLIGVDHSMGAAVLWLTEALHSGTFDGLVLFEPINGYTREADTGTSVAPPVYSKAVDILAAVTLQRESECRALARLRSFASWDPETLTVFLEGALLDQPNGSVVLACHPKVEASLYCDTPMYVSETNAAAPHCRISIQRGAHSRMLSSEMIAPIVAQLPYIYSMADPIPTHCM
uniref:AB hydrolase-1 domain-containing protein n=1 Tax=Globisporangium ultimum (strain ATCC 200006 / CBS 805.95 / DAOM BR144) TaxID=431595 RepID=K3X073_GLOUD